MSEALHKLPAITISFWIMKIAATTLGETAGDLISMTLNVGYAISSLLLISVFLITLVAQLASKHFHPLLYWLVILATSTAGTTISDYMDRTLQLGYMQGSLILVSLLVMILTLWKFTLGTLSVSHVTTRKQECFYWAAILVSNTLGTAFGDYLADDAGLGFAGAAVLITAGLVLLFLLYRFTKLSRVALFWAAFVLTRPFGATIGDVLTKPVEKGGIAFGTVGASIVLLGILLIFIYRTYYMKPKNLVFGG